jgi:hypothetical protein
MMKTGLTLILLTFALSACLPTNKPLKSDTPTPVPAFPAIPEVPTFSPPTINCKIDFISNNDMRLLPVHADLTTAVQIDISLAGKPAWIAGISFENGNAWAVEFGDGSLQALYHDSSGYAQMVKI